MRGNPRDKIRLIGLPRMDFIGRTGFLEILGRKVRIFRLPLPMLRDTGLTRAVAGVEPETQRLRARIKGYAAPHRRIQNG